MINQEKSSSSVFNMSLATLERIDILLRKLEEYNIMGGIIYIQRILLILYKELHPFLNKEECKHGDVIFEQIKKGVWIDGLMSGYDPNILDVITAFDFWIRDKLLEKGLLMAQGENPEFALMNG